MMSRRADNPSCASFLERLEAWIDDELPNHEVAALKAHVDVCVSCSEESRLAQLVKSELRALPELEPTEAMMRAVAEATRRPRILDRLAAIPHSRSSLAALAAILLLAIATPLWFEHRQPSFNEAEVQRAVAETRMALACVSTAANRAEIAVNKRALGERAVSVASRGIVRSLDWTKVTESDSTNILETKMKNNEGGT